MSMLKAPIAAVPARFTSPKLSRISSKASSASTIVPRLNPISAAPSGHIRAHTASSSFTPPQLAQLYAYPSSANGAGQAIALIELGGGYKPSDLTAYFKQLKINPAPKVTAVSVSHGQNAPTGDPNGPDGEVMLDIEVAGAIAPGAHIVVYFAPNTDQGFLNAITTAIHDKVNKPSIISISWGGPESTWTAQAMQQYDKAFQEAAALGVTVTVAAGDNGSSDGVERRRQSRRFSRFGSVGARVRRDAPRRQW